MAPSTRGRLLVASPDLADPNFRRTVILVLTHDAEGALGLVLNRPTDIAVAEALDEWAAVVAAPGCLFMGGPVQPEAAIGLGRGPTNRDDPIVGVLAPVDLEADAAGHENVRIFIGYAGWGPRSSTGSSPMATGWWSTRSSATSSPVDPTRSGGTCCGASGAVWRCSRRRPRTRR